MKVQTKVTLLLVGIIAVFLSGLAVSRVYDRARARRAAQDQLVLQERRLNAFVAKYAEPLETLSFYYSNWNQMLDAVGRKDRRWLESNLNDASLDGYRATVAWVFDATGALVYSVNFHHDEQMAPPISGDQLPKLFGSQPFAHFFTSYPDGLMELRGATIVPSVDGKHETQARGYLLVGNLWNKAFQTDLQRYTGFQVSITPAEKPPDRRGDPQTGSVTFGEPLNSWDGKPVAYLVAHAESPVVRELNDSNQRLLLILFLFSMVLLLVMSLGLVRWVNQPLRHIMESLSRNDLKPIERMAEERSEFGELARTIHRSFEQSERLIAEMKERRATEEALRKSEEELRHAQKMEAIGRLAGGVAHDFNNLLTAIIGYAELIAGRPKLNSQIKQNAELILKAGEQAATLTKQLLAFSRKQMMQPKVLDLNELIGDVEKLLRRVIGERYELITLRGAEHGRVRADPSQIEQVLLNLGVNARDAMPTGGRLTIRTANLQLDQRRTREIGTQIPPGDYVELSVTDSGCGMDEDTKSRIFEPFFTTKGPGKGTGLGLATVYGIVRQSGGAISVESEVGEGSTFRIYLPRETAPVDYTHSHQAPLEKSDNSETVLVVEDEEIVRELVCEVLEDQGYTVLCAANGAEALAMSRNYRGKIDLLVTDVIMPQMNGHELAIKLTEERPETKVLYVSGYSDNDIGDHGMLDPRYELLQKPFTPQTLARKIREVMHDGQFAAVS
jgi:signal transduction histidine kinase